LPPGELRIAVRCLSFRIAPAISPCEISAPCWRELLTPEIEVRQAGIPAFAQGDEII